MKLSELGKEFNLKAHEVLNIAKENGFELTSHTQNITETEEAELRNILAGKDDPELKAIDHYKFMGVYYDHRKRKYKLLSMVLTPEQVKGLPVVEEYTSSIVHELHNRQGLVLNKLKLFVESAVAKLLSNRSK